MKTRFTLFFSLFFCWNLITLAQIKKSWANFAPDEIIPGEVILKLDSRYRETGILHPVAQSVLREIPNCKAEKVFPTHKFHVPTKPGETNLSLVYRLRFPPNFPVKEVLYRLQSIPGLVYAEPAFLHKPFFTPNDPFIGIPSLWWINKLQAEAAWDISHGDANVVIGVVDTGVDEDHPDLVGNIKYNTADPIDGIDNDADGYVDNYFGWDLAGAHHTNMIPDNDPGIKPGGNIHGSLVCGLAGATTNNSVGLPAPGFNCKFLPIKASPDNIGILYRAYEGMVYAADHNCKIINCSFGSPSYSQYGQDVVNYCTFNKDALVVAAAGNSGDQTRFYPASFQHVTSVTASTEVDTFFNAT
ncbi:MAG: S8 family serine peptidase, partial [Bacteroidia bacterium]|nr:S8 family serine peptidase [Bacteroidia bacterium]